MVDPAGRSVGRVRDVVLVPDPTRADAPAGTAYRIDGLVVGVPVDGDRLGYGRTVHAPRLLAALFTARRRRQRYIRWADIDHTGPTIVLTADPGRRR
ncbi:hypothetical protein [Pseudonocardia adelaidensis]|uniref:PRC-barrel domain protein n=1 Tax=Pseudonocardia adelaidensis TaxID=648754 RepID=A0ABP9NLK2_9PSEU